MHGRIMLIGYNRPAETGRTAQSLAAALRATSSHQSAALESMVRAVLDGPKSGEAQRGDAARVEQVATTIRSGLPHVAITRHTRNRGLPSVILEGLDDAFSNAGVDRVICVEDDVDLSPTALSALLYTSERLAEPHVIAAAPLRDGIPPNQCMLLTREAHRASRPLIEAFIARFHLDGAYGNRDHDAIREWLAALAASRGVAAPKATSQDAVRDLAWRLEGVAIHTLPMRLVAHRGLRGQHNTPLHAIRTGGAFERLDRSPWELLAPRLDAWITRGGGTDEVSLKASERLLGSIARRAYQLVQRFRA